MTSTLIFDKKSRTTKNKHEKRICENNKHKIENKNRQIIKIKIERNKNSIKESRD